MNADKMFGVHDAVVILSASHGWCQSGNLLREAAFEVSERGYGFWGAYLSGRINDLGREVLAFIFDDTTEGILNGWIITINKVTVDKLDRQRGFACNRGQISTAADNKLGNNGLIIVRAYRQLDCRQWPFYVALKAPASSLLMSVNKDSTSDTQCANELRKKRLFEETMKGNQKQPLPTSVRQY